MGFLTTFTIYNDGLDNLNPDNPNFEKNARELAIALYNAGTGRLATPTEVGVGDHGNMLKIQKPRHAEHDTVYVHSGNTLCEVNAFCEETKLLMERNPRFVKNILFLLKHQVKNLAILLKQVRSKKGSTKSDI
jgi:hypothetical protein